MRRPSQTTSVLAALVASLLAVVGAVATGNLPESWKSWLPYVAWPGVALLIVAGARIEVRRGRPGEANAEGVELAEVASELAEVVEAQWRREEEHRRVRDPLALPVRWHTVGEELVDHWANIRCAPAGLDADPLELAGELAQIVSVYRRVPSGRLLVLGKTGSGKTILAVRFVVDFLAARAGADEPVPVVFRMGSWNPALVSFRDWLADQLIRDHPGLAAPSRIGPTLAHALIATDRILAVLDGFDEIAEDLRRPALLALNATSVRLLMTSRREEYAAAVADIDVLAGAAAIELDDVTPADLAGYLPRTRRATVGDHATGWQPVLAELQEHSSSPQARNLLAVLSTPLMVALAREIYRDVRHSRPAELLDASRFTSVQAIETHLLDAFIANVYRDQPAVATDRTRRWAAHDAQRWLHFIATHMRRRGTSDLAWWTLAEAVPRTTRTLVIGLISTLAAGAGVWLASLVADQQAVWLLAGGIAGLTAGLVTRLATEDAGQAGTGQRQRRTPRVALGLAVAATLGGAGWFISRAAGGLAGRPAAAFLVGLTIGLTAGFTYNIVAETPQPTKTRFGLQRRLRHVLGRLTISLGLGLALGLLASLFVGLPIGLALGIGLGLIDTLTNAFDVPIEIGSNCSPTELLAADRKYTLTQSLVFGLGIALIGILGGGLVFGRADGLAIGIIIGLFSGLSA
jgi:hypothetical protein